MVQVWRSYVSDFGRSYPMYSISAIQVNNLSTDINPIDLLPPNVRQNLLDVNNPCFVSGLTPRKLSLYASDSAQFLINYPFPFSQDLFDYLTFNFDVAAFEFIGEKLKYGRLKLLLDNV